MILFANNVENDSDNKYFHIILTHLTDFQSSPPSATYMGRGTRSAFI